MLSRLDNLKQLCILYYKCESQYKHGLPQDYVDDFADVSKPKRRISSSNSVALSLINELKCEQ